MGEVGLSLFFIILFGIMNYKGAKSVGNLQLIMVLIMCVAVVVSVAGVVVTGHFDVTNLQPAYGAEGKTLGGGFVSILALAPFLYVGFDCIPQAAALGGCIISVMILLLLIVPGSPAFMAPQSFAALIVWVLMGVTFYFVSKKNFAKISKREMDYLILGNVQVVRGMRKGKDQGISIFSAHIGSFCESVVIYNWIINVII